MRPIRAITRMTLVLLVSAVPVLTQAFAQADPVSHRRALRSTVALKTPQELVRIGYQRSRVVMMNEGHNGLKRCVRTRRVGLSILSEAYGAGVKHLAVEAMGLDQAQIANQTRKLPRSDPSDSGLLAQEDLRVLIQAALDLGWTLYAYDFGPPPPGMPPAHSLETSNWRDLQQATNLAAVLASIPAKERLLVWCGDWHLYKRPVRVDFDGLHGTWVTMGCHFGRLSGVEAFAIDQTQTIQWFPESQDPFPGLMMSRYGSRLESMGKTAGLLKGEDSDLDARAGVDAFLLSTENDLE